MEGTGTDDLDEALQEAFDNSSNAIPTEESAAYLRPVVIQTSGGSSTKGSSSMIPSYPALSPLCNSKDASIVVNQSASTTLEAPLKYPQARAPQSSAIQQPPPKQQTERMSKGQSEAQNLSGYPSVFIKDPKVQVDEVSKGLLSVIVSDRPQPQLAESKPMPERVPPDSSAKAGQTINMDIARRWKDVLVRAGLPLEYAWKYGLKLAEGGFDDTNAISLTDGDLRKRIGITNSTQRQSILLTIQEIAEELSAIHTAVLEDETLSSRPISEEDAQQQKYQRALGTWRNLFMKAKLGKIWGVPKAIQYAQALSKQGWDDWNLEDLTEGDLITAGIENVADREVILQLVEREVAEAEVHPQQAFVKVAVTKEEVEHIKQTKKEIAQSIEAIELFQKRLSEILSGDTDTQREARAKREVERAIRKAEREQRRQERMRQKSMS